MVDDPAIRLRFCRASVAGWKIECFASGKLRFSTAPRSARFSAVTLPPMPCTISRTIDNPSPAQGPGLMSWLGDGVASPPRRMRGPIVLTDDSAHDTQRSSAWRTVINMKMKSRGEPTSPIVATIASSFISSAVTWCAR